MIHCDYSVSLNPDPLQIYLEQARASSRDSRGYVRHVVDI